MGRREPARWPWLLPAALLLAVVALALAGGGADRRALINALLLAVAAAAAGIHHGRRSGPAAALLVTVVVFASVAFAQVFVAGSAIFAALAATVLACALALGGEHPEGVRMPELYPGREGLRRMLSRVAAGALVGLAAWVHPAYLLLLPVVARPAPAPASLAGDRRASTSILSAAVCAGVVAAGWWGGVPAQSWPPPPEAGRALDPALAGWNLLYLVAGRHVGLLSGYLPAVVLVAAYRRGSRRAGLLAAVVAATLIVTLWEPHDFWGGPESVGNRWFLPLYGALWFVPRRAPRGRWLLLAAAAAGLVLWPLWLAPRSGALRAVPPVTTHLPYETTQRHLPAVAEWSGTGVRLRSLGPALREVAGEPVLDPAGGQAEILVAAEQPLEALYLELGPRAETEIEVAGGELGDTLLRPDGGVRFEIRLGEPAASHPMWWGEAPHFLYLVRVRMPGASGDLMPVAIQARPEDALPRGIER